VCCLLSTACCLLTTVELDKHGQLVRNRGLGNVQKMVILGDLGREKEGQKGVFWASKPEIRRLFACGRGD